MVRHVAFPMMQGHLLRFEFVPRRPIKVTSNHWPVVCRQRYSTAPQSRVFLYPRSQSSGTRAIRVQRYLKTHSVTAPYSPYRNHPYCAAKWISSSTSRELILKSQPLRTMNDPVARTASPYVDPSVKGPKSQQLSSGLSRSLLQDRKSKDCFPSLFTHKSFLGRS
jgi:hypothetical protein